MRPLSIRRNQREACSSPEAGVTLLEVMVALGILGIVLMGVMNLLSYNSQMQSRVQQQSDLEDLRRYFASTVSCERTRSAAGGSCPSSATRKAAYRDSLSGTGEIVRGSGAFTSIGDYKIRMFCSGNVPMTLTFEAKGPNTDWINLFEKVPFKC